MATESRRRRRWVLPALLLGTGTWVIVRRRSAAEPVDVWAPRPSVERMVVPPAPTPPVPTPPAPTPAEPVDAAPVDAAPVDAAPVDPAPPVAGAPVPGTDLPVVPGPMPASVARPLRAASTPTVSSATAPATTAPATTAPATTAPATTAVPYGLGSAVPLPDGSAPGPEYTIKGNASSRLFHPPSSPYYGRTKAEVWFRTADEALAAGFSPYRSRRR